MQMYLPKVEQNSYVWKLSIWVKNQFIVPTTLHWRVCIFCISCHDGFSDLPRFQIFGISYLCSSCDLPSLIFLANSIFASGVWTDAHWVFSTGLDQRLRCWRMLSSPLPEPGLVLSDSILHNSQLPQISQSCSLIEWTHCMTSVPETEALHVEPGKTR